MIGVQYLLPTGGQKQYTISVICGAIINFFINIILIPILGAVGAAIGTVAAEASVTLIQLFYVREKINIKELIKMSKNYFICGILMFLICFIPNYIFNSYYLIIISKIIIGLIFYVLCLYLIKDEFVVDIKTRIFKLLQNRR